MSREVMIGRMLVVDIKLTTRLAENDRGDGGAVFCGGKRIKDQNSFIHVCR